MGAETSFIKHQAFTPDVVHYHDGWVTINGDKIPVLRGGSFQDAEDSWSSKIEDIHEESTKSGWIDVYERKKVFQALQTIFYSAEKKGKRLRVLEFGASSGYMISELKEMFPKHDYIATDLLIDGLERSYQRHPDIMHMQCDCTAVPIEGGSIDVVYALNMLEHVSDDIGAIAESYRILKPGGYVLYVVPCGDKLYDYFDEMLFHKRRYATGELMKKTKDAGFKVVLHFHFAWVCYPIFWLKKKWNRCRGKRMKQAEKLQAVEADIKNATSSVLAKVFIKAEMILSRGIHPSFGVREFILCQREIQEKTIDERKIYPKVTGDFSVPD